MPSSYNPPSNISKPSEEILYGAGVGVLSSPQLIYDNSNYAFQVGDKNVGIGLRIDVRNDTFSMGDGMQIRNRNLLTIDDLNQIVTLYGSKNVTVTPDTPGANFSGFGLDDMQNITGTYTNTETNVFTVVIDGVAAEATISGITGTIQVGDEMYGDVSGNYLKVLDVSGIMGSSGTMTVLLYTDDMATDNNLTGPGTTCVIDAPMNLGVGTGAADSFHWEDSHSGTEDYVPITTSFQSLGGLSVIQFGAAVGHTWADQWQFIYVVSYGDSIYIDSNGRNYVFGDVNATGNGTAINISDSSGTVIIGDVLDVVNGTGIVINDPHKIVVSYNAVCTPTMQIDTGGADATIADGIRGLYYDPPTIVTAATIYLPENPEDGQEVLVCFGGTIDGSAPVITSLTIDGNGNIILNSGLVTAANPKAGSSLRFKYRAGITAWYNI